MELPLINLDNPPEDAVIEVTHQGYIYWQTPKPAKNSSRSLKAGEDFTVYRKAINKNQQLVVITDSGKAYPVQVSDIPPVNRKQRTSLIELLPKSAQRDAKKIVGNFFLPQGTDKLDLVLLTDHGHIKRLLVSELANLTNRGLMLIKLKDHDCLQYVCFTQEGQEIAIATTGGRILRFIINDQQLPIMGRSAQGNQALRLRYGEELVGCVCLHRDDNLLLISQFGYGKRLPIKDIRLANRGNIGSQALQFTSKIDNLGGMVLAKAGGKATFLTSTQRGISLSVDSVPLLGKDGAGDLLVKLRKEEKIISLVN